MPFSLKNHALNPQTLVKSDLYQWLPIKNKINGVKAIAGANNQENIYCNTSI